MTKRTPSATATHSRPHVTKRAKFLAEMDGLVPWARLRAIVAKHYPRAGNGRPPLDLELMLRVYFLQHWFDLSDPAVEDMLYDSASMRTFAGVDPEKRRAPDETTVCKFRHLLERHRLGKRLFAAVNAHLGNRGIRVGNGTIVDATIVHAPSSTKNADGARDPEMHQTKKGNQWYFGMKLHAGADSATKIVHRLEATAANVHDSRVLPRLLHGRETRVWGDSAYRGHKAVIRARSPRARDFTCERATRGHELTDAQRAANRTKSRVRARVEHSFNVVKRIFGFCKTRYRGIAKNLNRAYVAFALANLFVSRNKLLRLQGI